jgi:hypothetical protein
MTLLSNKEGVALQLDGVDPKEKKEQETNNA